MCFVRFVCLYVCLFVFEDVGVNQVSPLELSQLVSMMDVDGDNAIEYDEFVKLFSSNVPTSERAALLRTITAAGDGGGGGGGGGEKENDREMAERREREMVVVLLVRDLLRVHRRY